MSTKTNRRRSAKIHLWMDPELVEKINQKAYEEGLSRDGAFERGMNLWVSANTKGNR